MTAFQSKPGVIELRPAVLTRVTADVSTGQCPGSHMNVDCTSKDATPNRLFEHRNVCNS